MARLARPWYNSEKSCYMAWVGGKRVRLVDGTENPTNFQAAKKALKSVLTVRRSAVGLEARRHTVASVIEQYLRLNHQRYTPRALEARKRYLQLFAEAHGWRPVTDKDCLPVHVEEWLAAHPEWKSAWTQAIVVSTILRPFNWAATKRLIPSNPFRGVEKHQGDARRPLTDAEYQALLRATNTWATRKRAKHRYPCNRRRRMRPSMGARFREVLTFLRFTGARPGELSALEWPDVDFQNRVIRLTRHKTAKKTKKPRVIPLHPVIVKLLAYVRRRSDPGPRVFLTHRLSPWNRSNLALRIQRSRKLAGIPADAKLYGLRHRFGTTAVLRGVDLKTLSEVLGHTSVRMSEHYVSLAGQQAHLAEAVLKINASPIPPGGASRRAS